MATRKESKMSKEFLNPVISAGVSILVLLILLFIDADRFICGSLSMFAYWITLTILEGRL